MEINQYDYVADIYDTYVPATFDIDFFIKESKKVDGEVLELMSGTGRVSIPLIEAGVKLTCVDFSAKSNVILENKIRQLGLKAEVLQMDICDLDLRKQFEMVIIPFHSFAHLTSPDRQIQALTRIYQHLLPGGTFICTLGNPKKRSRSVDGQLRFFRKYPLPDSQGVLLFWIMENYHPADRQVVEAMQFYEEYDGNGMLRSKRFMELHFRLTTKGEFEDLAKTAGFRVKAMYGDYTYADFSEESPFMIWILEKAH